MKQKIYSKKMEDFQFPVLHAMNLEVATMLK